jgi:hypothetical protein
MWDKLSPWLQFAEATFLGVTFLVFAATLALYLTITILVWREGDPYVTSDRLPELGLLSLVGAACAGGFTGLAVALFGWPSLLLATRIFGLNRESHEWAISVLKPNYVSIGIVGLITAATVLFLLVETRTRTTRSLRDWIANRLDIWWATRHWPYPAYLQSSSRTSRTTKPEADAPK